MLTREKNRKSFYAIKRQMATMVMSIGLIIGLSLVILQLYINQSANPDSSADSILAASTQVIQPFAEVVYKVISSLFFQGVL